MDTWRFHEQDLMHQVTERILEKLRNYILAQEQELMEIPGESERDFLKASLGKKWITQIISNQIQNLAQQLNAS